MCILIPTAKLELAITTDVARHLSLVTTISACIASSAKLAFNVIVCDILALFDVTAPALVATSEATATLPALASSIFNSAAVAPRAVVPSFNDP